MEFSAELANLFLLFEPDDRLQTEFDSFPLGFDTGCGKCLGHQLVVDFNVGTHGIPRDVYRFLNYTHRRFRFP
ncbi:hypothetical protein BSLA_03f1648 [Burkholderia stabilis]|nr:hypothetical protein BSLA_03f1648 [Burkholderia stabilis]